MRRDEISLLIEEFMEMIGMSEPLEFGSCFDTYKEGKIVVVGGTDVKEETLLGI